MFNWLFRLFSKKFEEECNCWICNGEKPITMYQDNTYQGLVEAIKGEPKMVHERSAHVDECKRLFHLFAKHKRFLMKHVKKGDKPLGTILIWMYEGELKFGFSLLRKGDKYNRYIGIFKALKDSLDDKRDIPHSLNKEATRMINFAISDRGQEILNSPTEFVLKQAQEAVQRSNEQVEQLHRTLNIGMWVF